MAEMKIQIPAPCDYEAELANEKNSDMVIIPAYDNRERHVERDEK